MIKRHVHSSRVTYDYSITAPVRIMLIPSFLISLMIISCETRTILCTRERAIAEEYCYSTRATLLLLHLHDTLDTHASGRRKISTKPRAIIGKPVVHGGSEKLENVALRHARLSIIDTGWLSRRNQYKETLIRAHWSALNNNYIIIMRHCVIVIAFISVRLFIDGDTIFI